MSKLLGFGPVFGTRVRTNRKGKVSQTVGGAAEPPKPRNHGLTHVVSTCGTGKAVTAKKEAEAEATKAMQNLNRGNAADAREVRQKRPKQQKDKEEEPGIKSIAGNPKEKLPSLQG